MRRFSLLAFYVLLAAITLAQSARADTISTAFGGHNGDGFPAALARLNPRGMARDTQGNIYIADTNGQRIRKVDTLGITSTVAGSGVSGFAGDGGPATSAKLNTPSDVAVDSAGNLYIADQLNNRIRRVDALTGIITTVAGVGASGFNGDNQPATLAQLNFPAGVDALADGSVLIADSGNHRIRRVSGGTITTIAGTNLTAYNGDGIPATTANLSNPVDVTHDSAGNVYISDASSCRVRRIDSTGMILMVAGSGKCEVGGDGLDARTVPLKGPGAITWDAARVMLYIAETTSPRVRGVNMATQIINTVAGDGVPGSSSGDGGDPKAARFGFIAGLLVDGDAIYIADGGNTGNNNVRLVSGAPAATPTPMPATPTRTATVVPATATIAPTSTRTFTPTVSPTRTGCMVVPCPA